MLHVPDYIESLKPYVPGKPIEELERELGVTDSIKLASNESPLGPSPLAIKEIRAGAGDLNRYPDGSCHLLKKALSETLDLSPDEILPGNGSSEVIELAVRTFLTPGDEAIMAHPSFVAYSMIVQAAGGRSVSVPLRQWRHDLNAMASRITGRTRIIFIANPNNPTGTIVTSAEMDSFMKKVPDGILVIVDEAYREYVTSTACAQGMKYFTQGRDVLLLRTFSKIYGLAGLRVGYGIAKPPIISEMNKVRPPFNVNSLAQKAAIAALRDNKHLDRAKKINQRGREFLYRELKKLNIKYLPTEANFIYIIFDSDIASRICNDLLRKGVIVRPLGPRDLRVTIGLHRENRRFIETVRTARFAA